MCQCFTSFLLRFSSWSTSIALLLCIWFTQSNLWVLTYRAWLIKVALRTMFRCHLFNCIDLIDEVGVVRLVVWSQVKELCSFTDLGNAWWILLNCYSIVFLSEIDTISSSFITTMHRRLICKQVLFWLHLERFR